MTPASSEANQTLAGTPRQEQAGEPAKVALQGEIEELIELTAQRVYAPAPVQSRPGYLACVGAAWNALAVERLPDAKDGLLPIPTRVPFVELDN